MAVKDIFKISLKTYFNPKGWIGYPQLKKTSSFIFSMLAELLTVPSTGKHETFDAAVKRQKLSTQDIQNAKRLYFTYSLLFCMLGIFSIVFGFYLVIFHKTLAGLLLAFATSSLFFVYAFKYNFYYFQIKHRKLGCTLPEWWQGKITGASSRTHD